MLEPFQLKETAGHPPLLVLAAWERRMEGLSVGFTTRAGGTSQGHLAGLNCALHVGDREENVLENRKKVARAAGFDFESWTCAEQVHGRKVTRVTRADRGRGRRTRESAIADTDALITDEKDVLLTSFYADCVPLYFFDPDHMAVGLAHAGWKGTVLEIAAAVVEEMAGAFGTRPDRLLAAIGPSIGPCCYEVDEPVVERFAGLCRQGRLDARKDGLPSGVTGKGGGRFDLDLKDLNRQIMIKAGIDPVHIECSKWCTSCHPKWFFSHRRDRGKSGRMASWIGIKGV